VSFSPLALPAIARFGRYDILGRIALGGMAEIFLAREQGPGRAARAVVLKRVLPHVADDRRFIDMFLQEAEIAIGLSHPNLCPIYEFGEHEGSYFIAMEWVRGLSITQIHKRVFERGGSGIPAPILARVAADIADALHHAHMATGPDGRPLQLVHRDVTPDNIMISFDGKVKLLDFGVAKAASQRVKTEAGMLKGKFAYMAPEQYRGETLDGRADVFALGVCMYEALTGLALYHRPSEYETMGAILSDDEAPHVRAAKPSVPPGLDALVAAALEKDRDARPRTAHALNAGLERYLVSQGLVVRAKELTDYLRELAPAEASGPPEVDTRRELWTRENLSSERERLDLREELAREADAGLDAIAAQGRRKSVTVYAVIALVVLGLLGLVVTRIAQVSRAQSPQSSLPGDSVQRTIA
jgi:eukaryotic-like serine/threonine-protein kinase